MRWKAVDEKLSELEMTYAMQYILATRVSESFTFEYPTYEEWRSAALQERHAALYDLGPTGDIAMDVGLFDLLEQELRLAVEALALAQRRPPEALGGPLSRRSNADGPIPPLRPRRA